MANNPHYPEGPSLDSPASSDSDPSPSSSAFITNSRNFTIAGGQFTSNVINCAPTIPSDFRMIPLGDLDLRHEICLDGMVAKRKLGLPIARRIYSARVGRKQSDMTVAVYQGENAEKTWRCELANYSGLRHPNIVQLYGAVNSGGLYAMIFHDDLVSSDEFLEEYRHSVLSAVYLHRQFNTELDEGVEYVKSLLGEACMLSYRIMPWIRRSTGRLCVEIASKSVLHGIPHDIPFVPTDSSHIIPLSSLGSDPETRIIDRLTMAEFHNICNLCLSRTEYRPLPDKVHLGAIGSLQDESLQQIAHIPNCPFNDYGWSRRSTHMNNGWSRLHSSGVTEGMFYRILAIYTGDYWLCQANYIISQQNQKNCFLIYRIDYWLLLSGTPEIIPEGYLFLCPVEHLRDDMGRWVPNPECPAYWSLDPSGNQRLSPEEASGRGFPAFKLEMIVEQKSWHESVYEALSRFHAGKGFDPNSQDLARHLGQPLYELSRPTDSAHIEELDSNDSDDAIVAQNFSAHIEEVDSNASEDAVLMPEDTLQPQKFRVIILGCLGLILALVVSWSYINLGVGGEKDRWQKESFSTL